MTIIVAICGKAGSGKDTAARILSEMLSFTRIAFADPLKEALAIIANEPVEYYHDNAKKEEICPLFNMTRREAMQKFGTEAVRGVLGDNIWLERALQSIKTLQETRGRSRYVVTDCRFDNEARALKEHGAIIVEIERPDHAPQTPKHSSERGISPELVDYIIVNDSTIDALHWELIGLVSELVWDRGVNQ